MGALLLLSVLPMMLAFGLFDGGDDDEQHDDPEGERIQAEADQETIGTAGDDTITGTDGADTISGEGGDDAIYLGDGDDHNADADTYLDALIDNFLSSDPGDTIAQLSEVDFFGSDGGAGNDYIDGGAGHDAITGGAGDDTLRGGLDSDLLMDSQGSDELYGGYGGDDLVAVDDSTSPDAPDLLDGGAQDDFLLGDDGDTMTGGTGLDEFGIVWQPGDAAVTITDFGEGDFNDTIAEGLTVQTASWSNSQSVTVSDSDDGATVSIDGEVVAVLNGVPASHAVEHVNLQVGRDTVNLISPTYIGGIGG